MAKSNIIEKITETSEDIIDKIVNAFKTNSAKKPSTQNTNSSKTLVENLTKMDNEYKQKRFDTTNVVSDIPTTLGLKKKDNTKKTEQEIVYEAENDVQPKYQEKVQKLESNYNTDLLSNNEKINKLNTEYQNNTFETDVEKNNAVESYQNKMIKQGLTNSSINDNGLEDINQIYSAKQQKIDKEYDDTLIDIKSKNKLLTINYKRALEVYDIKMAEEINQRIGELELEEEKRIEEIDAYNKKIDEKEQKYQESRAKTIAESKKDYINQVGYEMSNEDSEARVTGTYNGEREEEMSKRYKLAYNVFSKMDKSEALKLINESSTELKQTLGAYYDKLIQAISAK